MKKEDTSVQSRLLYLREKSSFSSQLNWDDFFDFYQKKDLRIKNNDGISLINGFIGCENCHVGFQIDTYIEGCSHNCMYCYAKIEGEIAGKWNNPLPLPLDLTLLWLELYKHFECQNSQSKYHQFFKKKVPLRLGSLSDPFIPMEKKFKITRELILLLQHYDYPYIIITRSDLIAEKEYLDLMSHKLASIHISIPSLNEDLTKKLEPGAPGPKQRLECIKTLRDNKFWVTARVNPLFPIHPDKTFTGVGSQDKIEFNFFSFELIDEIINTGCKSILAGFVTLKEKPLRELSSLFEFDLKKLMLNSETKDFYFSPEEIRSYFQQIRNICQNKKVDFSTCYLGQSSEQYFSNQDLWSNLSDCCNSIGKVAAHKQSSTSIPKHDLILIEESDGLVKKLTLKLLSYLLKRLKS
jgi:DNA repair photolyase